MVDDPAANDKDDDVNDVGDDALIVSKIETLLLSPSQSETTTTTSAAASSSTSTGCFTAEECTLVALVLLSRVTRDAEYARLWQVYGTQRLVPFCTQWLRSCSISGSGSSTSAHKNTTAHKNNNKNNNSQRTPSIRWTCAWTNRLANVVMMDECVAKRQSPAAVKEKKMSILASILESMRQLLWEYGLLLTAHQHGGGDKAKNDKDGSVVVRTDMDSASLAVITEVTECLLPLETILVVISSLSSMSNSTSQDVLRARLEALWKLASNFHDSSAAAWKRAAATSWNDADSFALQQSENTSSQLLMYETLAQLLKQETISNHTRQDEEDKNREKGDDDDEDSWTAWKRSETGIQALYVQQAKLLIASSFGNDPNEDNDALLAASSSWMDILLYWWNKKTSSNSTTTTGVRLASSKEKERRKEWTIVLLQLLIEACQVPHCSAAFWHKCWSMSSRWSCWTRLTTTCFSTTEADDDALRSLVWTATAQVVQCTTWRSILSLKPEPELSSSAIPTWITTVVHFAVGEAKIQLGWLVSSPTTDALDEHRKILIHATCRVVVLCMDLIRELSEKNDDDDDQDIESNSVRSLPAVSIQSLHRALEEGLDTAVQYLNLAERRIVEVDESVVRVLGCLMTEFDVFARSNLRSQSRLYDLSSDGLNADNDANENNTATLTALVTAMRICPAACRRELLIGLATVLASAEGDKARVTLLKETTVLGEDMAEFLKYCWEDSRSDGSVISLACDTVEVLLDVNPVTEVGGLQSVILKWIQRASGLSSTPGQIAAVQSSVACYVRLQGERPPEEADATIIRNVLEAMGAATSFAD